MRLGKDKHATLLAVFLVFAASASGQTGINYKFQLSGDVQNTDVVTGNQSITINYYISELNVESLSNSAGTFYRIIIPGHIPSTDSGKPELPVFSRIISISEGSEFRIKISNVRSTRLRPSAKKVKGSFILPRKANRRKLYKRGVFLKLIKQYMLQTELSRVILSE